MALAAATGWTGAAHAGQLPIASVTSDCDGEVGLIVVTISDVGAFTYDILIDEEPIDTDVSIDGEEELVIDVPENGDYFVEVFFIEGDQFIVSESVTVECAPVETTTTTTVPTEPPPDTEAVVAEPDFTG